MAASKEQAPRMALSPMENLGVGALGGALEVSIQMPILTFKFCVQEGRALPTSAAGWYRGVGVQAGTVAPITAIQMMVNGFLGKVALRGDVRELTDQEKIVTAFGAGAISALVYSPVDLVTIQQQKLAKNPLATLKHLVNNHGVSSLLRGFSACAVRESIYTAGYLGLAPVATSALCEKVAFFQDKPFAAGFTGACFAGTLAALLTHPADTAKTCVQSDMMGTQWASARAVVPKLIAEGGIGSLYKGGLARTVRLCGAFFICMTLREYAIDVKTEQAKR